MGPLSTLLDPRGGCFIPRVSLGRLSGARIFRHRYRGIPQAGLLIQYPRSVWVWGDKSITLGIKGVTQASVVLAEGFGLIRRRLTIRIVNAATSVVGSTLVNPTVMGKFVFPALIVITTNGYKVNDSIFNSGKVCDFSSPYLNGLPVIQLTSE